MMPVEDPDNVVTLGEGGTPLLRARRLGERAGFSDLWIKDEAANPTGSFKARGLSAAVSRAKELGYAKIALPTAGNAGGAAAAYAARRGNGVPRLHARDTPPLFRLECERYGAKVTLVDGLIDDCGRIVAERAPREGWHDVSTLKEPYRVEGKKTMGYELAEEFDWELPDAIVYPTAGGTGLIGMWKAFDEMEEMGWIGPKRPRIFACRRRVRADSEGVRLGRGSFREMGGRRDICLGLASPEGVRRLSDPAGPARVRGRRRRSDRRGDARRRA
jgi:threonine synthase